MLWFLNLNIIIVQLSSLLVCSYAAIHRRGPDSKEEKNIKRVRHNKFPGEMGHTTIYTPFKLGDVLSTQLYRFVYFPGP